MNFKPIPFRARLEQYKKEAKELVNAFKAGDPNAMRLVKRYDPRLPGRADTNDRNLVTEAEIRKVKLSQADAQYLIARGHQFEDWPTFTNHIKALNQMDSPVWQFEKAVEAIVTGDAATLKRLLRANPKLIRARSTREHHATLLHYVGANAVEDYNQKTPKNAVQVAKILLEAGAEVDADLDYGAMKKRYPERAGSTTLGMAATSCHPANAGVQIALLETLLAAGAFVDGVPGKWNIVIAALHNGRGRAAEYLARRGARLDLEGAAGTGRLDVVKTFFNKDGRLKATATKTQMELGFIWACEYGRKPVVAFLLQKGMDVAAQPHGETGLHWAAYGGHAQIVKMLLKRSPPLDVKDARFDGTPLDWALHGWCNPAPESNRAGYYEVVVRLVAAGTIVDAEWLEDPHRTTPIGKKVRGDRRMRSALRGKMQRA
jgi:ankyrin repeat protein